MTPHPISDQARRLGLNFTWLMLQEAFIRIVGLLTAVYLARTLGASDYGTLGMALAIVGIAGALVQAGTGNWATRLTARDPAAVPDIYARVMGLRLTAAVVLIAILAALAPLISTIASLPATLLTLCAFLLLRNASTVAWAFRGLDQMRVIAVTDMSEKALTLVGLVLLVKGVGNDMLLAPVVEFAAAMSMIVWMRSQLRRRYPGLKIRLQYDCWLAIIREALPLSFAALIGAVYLHGIVLLVGWLAAPAAAAEFLAAQKVMLALALLLAVINRSAFPTASRLLVHDGADALNLMARLLRFYLVLIFPVILLVAFHGKAVLSLLFGPAYSGAGRVLLILLGALPFLAVNNSLQMLLKAIPRPMPILVARIAGTVGLLFLSAPLIPGHGAEGAAAAIVGGEIITAAIMLVSAKRVTGGLPLNGRSFTPLAAAAAAAAAYALAPAWPLPARLPAAAAVYVLSVLLLKALTLEELRLLPHLLLVGTGLASSVKESPENSAVQPDPEKDIEKQPKRETQGERNRDTK